MLYKAGVFISSLSLDMWIIFR